MKQEFHEIYEKYSSDLYTFILRLCGNEQLAKDILQDTMLKAMTSADSFRGSCSVRTWLCTIAKNLWYDHLKKAIDFSMNRLGAHSMPAGLYADWNDCLRLGKKGESSFVAFQLYYAMSVLKAYAEERGDKDYVAYIDKVQPELGKSLAACWDEDRFIRG